MVETTADSLPPRPSGPAAGGEVTVMDLWLVIRSRSRFALSVVVGFAVLGIAVAFMLSPVHRYTTAIEIGNQVVNDEIIPIEASTTVLDKLVTGYIPLITTQFVQENPQGPEDYEVEVQGSENSQIVQMISEGPRAQQALYNELHRRIVETLVEDHNRTVDAMRDNAEIALAEAQQKLGEMVAQERALTMQLNSIGDTLGSLDRESSDLRARIADAEAQVSELRQQPGSSSERATQILMLTNQIGAWRTVLVNIENRDKVNIFATRAEAQVKLDNNEQEQNTATNEIEFRTTNLENIQATRAIGQGTVMSIKPVAPNKPLILAVAVVMGLLVAVAGALVLDFLNRAETLARGQQGNSAG